MDSFFPVMLLCYLSEFCQCFTRPSFAYFKAYVWAMMVNNGSKCMTNIASCCFFLGKNITSFQRFLSENQWDISAVAKKLVQVLIARLGEKLLVFRALLACVDTTLVAKESEKMLAVQRWHKHSGNADQLSSITGHHWGIIGLIVKHPIRYICLPILARLIAGNKNQQMWISGSEGTRPADFWDCVVALVFELKTYLPNTLQLRIVADAYFSKAPFINPLLEHGIHLISRLRKDAIGWDQMQVETTLPRKRGRPKTKGKIWKLVDLLKLPRQPIDALIYGELKTLQVVVRDVYLRDVKKLVRVVAIETATKPLLLVCTDLTLSAQQIVEIYGSRFSIELTIRDLKQHFGFGDYQCYSTIAFLRFVFLSCVSFCLWMLLLIENNDSIFLNFPADKSFHSESLLSFCRLKRVVKKFVCSRIIFRKSANLADYDEIQRELDSLLSVA
jgi:hypothetical protein